MKKVYLLFVALVSLGAVSCSDDDNTLDTQKPSVSILSPTVDQEIPLNSVLQVQASLKDNVALASYKIEVHGAEDGHQHKTASKAATEFHYEQSFALEGELKDYNVNQSITIPSDAKEQHYHVGIFVIDKAGNQSEQFIEVFIGDAHHH